MPANRTPQQELSDNKELLQQLKSDLQAKRKELEKAKNPVKKIELEGYIKDTIEVITQQEKRVGEIAGKVQKQHDQLKKAQGPTQYFKMPPVAPVDTSKKKKPPHHGHAARAAGNKTYESRKHPARKAYESVKNDPPRGSQLSPAQRAARRQQERQKAFDELNKKTEPKHDSPRPGKK